MEIGLYIIILLLTFGFQLLKRLSGKNKEAELKAAAKRGGKSAPPAIRRGGAPQQQSKAPSGLQALFGELDFFYENSPQVEQTAAEKQMPPMRGDASSIAAPRVVQRAEVQRAEAERSEVQRVQEQHAEVRVAKLRRAGAEQGQRAAVQSATPAYGEVAPLEVEPEKVAMPKPVVLKPAQKKIAKAEVVLQRRSSLRSLRLKTLLKQNRSTVRDAIVLSELLSPPLARRNQPGGMGSLAP